jgi:hypothetical protein
LKGDPSYELELRIYEELKRQGVAEFEAPDFGTFIRMNHSESNWFLAALRAAQPYLCGSPESSEKTSQKEERQRLGVPEVAADEIAKKGLEKALEPVVIGLCSLVPFLAGRTPTVVTTGFSIFLVHYAKAKYCSAEIQSEIINTLKWRNWENK